MSSPVKSVFESGGDVATVFQVLTSPRWPQRKADELKDGSRLVERTERSDGGLLFAVSRALPDGVPGPLQRFLPADGRVLQTDEWAAERDGARTGTWKVEIPGAPARLGGTMRLEPTAQGSRYTIEGEVKVKVPVVGGKAETFIASMVHKLAEREATMLVREVTDEVQGDDLPS